MEFRQITNMKENAFPFKYEENNTNHVFPGMNLRDYFAAKAMQGLIAHHGLENIKENAVMSYKYADQMMKERNNND